MPDEVYSIEFKDTGAATVKRNVSAVGKSAEYASNRVGKLITSLMRLKSASKGLGSMNLGVSTGGGAGVAAMNSATANLNSTMQNLNTQLAANSSALASQSERMAGLGVTTSNTTNITNNYSRSITNANTVNNTAAAGFGNLAGSIKRVVGAYGVFMALRGSVNLSDEWIQLNSAVRIVTNSEEELIETRTKLIAMSKANRSDIGATTKLYQRLMLAQKTLGKSSDDVLKFTDVIQKSLIVTSASGEEARSALMQLSQGMSDTTFKAEEFNSVMVAMPSLMMDVAESYDTSTKGLKDMLSAGIITNKDLFERIVSLAPRVSEQMSKVGVTFSQAGQNIKTSMIELIGSFNETTKASTKAAGMLMWLGDNMKTVALIAVGLAGAGLVAWASSVTLSITGMVAAFTTLKIAATATLAVLVRTAAVSAAFFGVFEAAKTFFSETKTGAILLLQLGQALEIAALNFELLASKFGGKDVGNYNQRLVTLNKTWNTLIKDVEDKDFTVKSFGEKLFGNIQEDVGQFVDAINIATDSIDLDFGADSTATTGTPADPTYWENLTKSFQGFSDSFATGMREMQTETESLGTILSDQLGGAITSASDEMAKFAVTGEADFKSMAQSIVQDIISIIIQRSILNAVSGIGGALGFGGVSDTASTSSLSGRQFGGNVQKGVPYDAGEVRGEVFIPHANGKIDANPSASGESSAPNIRINNMVDSNAVWTGADQSTIDKVVGNYIVNNTNAVRGALGV